MEIVRPDPKKLHPRPAKLRASPTPGCDYSSVTLLGGKSSARQRLLASKANCLIITTILLE